MIHMKSLLLSLGTFFVSSALLAADLPSKKAPVVAPDAVPLAYSWTGAYIGASIGGGFSTYKAELFGPTGSDTHYSIHQNMNGILGGVFAGYNYQLSNNVVLGVEADLDASGVRARTTAFTNPAGVVINSGSSAEDSSTRLPWQGSLSGRLGYAFGNVLLYTTGGVAYAQVKSTYNWLAPPAGRIDYGNHGKFGWTLGVGAEYALNQNWSVRGEYRYESFGSIRDNLVKSSLGAGVPGTSNYLKFRLNENIIKVGVAYKF